MVRIAICGVGNIGKVHLGSLRSMRGCEIAGLYDTQGTPLRELAASCGVRAYRSTDDLFADSLVDAVVIATPSDSHRELTERALRAGKHVFVEKPLAGTLEDAQAIVEAAAMHPRQVVQAGFCERFNPQFIEAKRAAENGLLGRLRSIHSSRISPYALGNTAWELGALDTAVHNLDLIMWLLDQTPTRVFARGVRIYPDSEILHSITILLEFANGALATDIITWLSDAAHPLSQCARARMNILGERGSFEIDLSARPAALLTANEFREIDTVILGGDGYYGCLKLQFEAFLRSIEEGVPVLAPVKDAYRAEQVVLAAQYSLQTGKAVEIA
jgi:myo-inositol 2-dehydrogenase/D-chiro-inositol 1-dehydrogenase